VLRRPIETTSLKREVKKKHNSNCWSFSCFAALADPGFARATERPRLLLRRLRDAFSVPQGKTGRGKRVELTAIFMYAHESLTEEVSGNTDTFRKTPKPAAMCDTCDRRGS